MPMQTVNRDRNLPAAPPTEVEESPEFEADLTPQRYYRGTIVKLQEGSQRGIVRSASGRLIPFSFMFLTMGGAHKISDLRLGMEVGYDVSHTAHGLRVSVIRIP